MKFQDDLYNQSFVIKTDCNAAKFMFKKDFKHDVSKQMFARWQAHLAPFDFQIIYKKGEDNSLPDYLTRELIKNPKIKGKINLIRNKFSLEICNEHPNAFWDRKKHEVDLPYEDDFKEEDIPTKARRCV